jgi:hypothetical protein
MTYGGGTNLILHSGSGVCGEVKIGFASVSGITIEPLAGYRAIK